MSRLLPRPGERLRAAKRTVRLRAPLDAGSSSDTGPGLGSAEALEDAERRAIG